jgi:hypothetical protein
MTTPRSNLTSLFMEYRAGKITLGEWYRRAVEEPAVEYLRKAGMKEGEMAATFHADPYHHIEIPFTSGLAVTFEPGLTPHKCTPECWVTETSGARSHPILTDEQVTMLCGSDGVNPEAICLDELEASHLFLKEKLAAARKDVRALAEATSDVLDTLYCAQERRDLDIDVSMGVDRSIKVLLAVQLRPGVRSVIQEEKGG